MPSKARKFKAVSGAHISIYVPWRPEPIEIMEGGTFETTDPREIDALQGSPDTAEIRAGRPSGSATKGK